MRLITIRKRSTVKGGRLSNVTKLSEDFAKQVTFGKSEPSSLSPDKIKKKFSI